MSQKTNFTSVTDLDFSIFLFNIRKVSTDILNDELSKIHLEEAAISFAKDLFVKMENLMNKLQGERRSQQASCTSVGKKVQ